VAKFRAKIVDEKPRPENTTSQCGACSNLGRQVQSRWIVRVGFTYMRGEDECADLCDEHRAELRKVIHQPGMFPEHLQGEIWR